MLAIFLLMLKNHLLPLFFIIAIFSLVSCGDGQETTTAVTTLQPTATYQSLLELEPASVQLWSDGRLTDILPVSATLTGACWLGSLLVERPDAWRCAYDDNGTLRILDPCLANPENEAGELACLNADSSLTLLTLQEPLPTEYANGEALDRLPLRVELADGDACGLILGVTLTLPLNGEAQRVTYACDSGGILIGLPQEQNGIWTITANADGQGGAEMVEKQIVAAFTFNGQTGSFGGAPLGAGDARVTAVHGEALPGRHQFTLQFDSPDLPAFEVGYVNEPYADLPPGAKILRIGFTYPVDAQHDYAGERVVSGDFPEHLNGVQLVVDDGRELIWALGLDEMVGFAVNRAGDQFIFTLYEPVPQATDRPDLGVGSRGTAVRVVQSLLLEMGYLATLPPEAKYDEPTRQAVVAFQEEMGILPNGVVGADTWAALARDVPPQPDSRNGRGIASAKNQSSTPGQQTAPHVTPNSAAGAHVRSGPGLNYDILGTLAAGDTIEVVGIQEGSSLDTTWLQVCCLTEQAGWVRADVVRLDGSTADFTGASPDHATPQSPVSAEGLLPSQRPSHTGSGQPILYFTFDDGPSAYTAQVTAIMAQFNGKTTFFTIGQNVDALPTTAKAAYDAGHAVENHTYHHASLDQLSPTEFTNEVENNQVAIQKAAGHLPICLRPPYGATDQQTYQRAEEMGLEISLWDIDTQDWRRPGVDAIADHILESAFPGAVILMHDGGGDRSMSVQALQQALPQLQQQGYVFNMLCR